MAKRKDTAQQRLLAAARKALAAQHASSPVPAYNSKTARIDAAGKRARRSEGAPPLEQMSRVPFIETDINEHSMGYDEDGNPYVTKVRIGRAYQRQARFETMAELTPAAINALRRYRRAFDQSEISPVKSALDIGSGGGGGGAEAALTRLEKIAFADQSVLRIERSISPDLLGTLRGVALHDLDFKALAAARYGSTSGQRRAQVKQAFLIAVDQLVRQGRADEQAGSRNAELLTGAGRELPAVNPAFLDDAGRMRPFEEIAAILRGEELAGAVEGAGEEHI